MRCVFLSACLSTLAVLPASIGWSQVTADSTLNTTVSSAGSNFTITNGTARGSNLFHSFGQFGIPTGGSATFDLINTPTISTIFSRVTGGSVSNIDGVIQTVNSANPVSLFLINPAGILFGPNASLNMGGSFIGTTANSIQFADGTEFSAVNPAAGALLTVSVPIGLQMGSNSGAIGVQGTGHRMSIQTNAPLNRSSNPIGLQVGAGNTLALIGHGVNVTGGIITTNGGGHLEVGSVREGQVRLSSSGQGWVGDYLAIQQFSTINLVQQSLLDASGSSGSIQLQGETINLTDGSTALIQGVGAQPAKGITVRATKSLNLTGNTLDGRLGSRIEINNLGVEQAGDINVSAANLLLKDAGQLRNSTFTPAQGGNVIVHATDLITVDGVVAKVASVSISAITTLAEGFGKAGDVSLFTHNLTVLNGGNITSIGSGVSAQSGVVQVNAKNLIEIIGNDLTTLTPSGINSTTFRSGNANNVIINTAQLVLRDGGTIASATLSTGSAGSVILNASESVEVRGRAARSIRPSSIASTATILDPASQAFFDLPPIPSGDAGSLTINTARLRVVDGGSVNVQNDGPGRAGDLQINANSIDLDNQGRISASTASGNGGNIRLNLQESLLMRRVSLVSATAGGMGDGGNITINSPIIAGFENSDIIATAVRGRGGNIQITTEGIFGLKFRPQLTRANDITASSQFGINGTVQVNTIGVDPSTGLVALPVDLTDPSRQIATGCAASGDSSFVVTGRGGLPDSPTQPLRSDRTWADTRDLSAFRSPSTGQPFRQPVETLPTPFPLEATMLHRNANGGLELVAGTAPTRSGAPVSECSSRPNPALAVQSSRSSLTIAPGSVNLPQ
jgi:filamentous hemagglutinin family protein